MADSSVKLVYALVGTDSFLQLESLGEILKRLPADAQRVNVDGATAEAAEVFDDLRSFAMFGSGKLLVMRNADEFIARWRESLENYLNAPSNSATLVLRVNSLPGNQRVSKLIAKVGEVIKCDPPRRDQLSGWIIQRGKSAHQITLDLQAANLLAELIGDDLGRLDNELAKLALNGKQGKVGIQDIDRAVVFQREQEMWDMTNAIAAGNPTEAVTRWRQLMQLDSSTEFRAVTWLALWLEDARKVVSAAKQGKNPASVLPVFKYRDPKLRTAFVQNAQRLGEIGVARAIDLLTEVDRRSKSGLGDAATNVERFLLTVGMK